MTGHLDIELECLKKFADFKIISVAPLADSNSFLVNLSNRGLDATCIVRVIEKNDKYSLKYTFKTLCDNLGIDINLSENYNDYRPYKIYMDNLLLPKIKKKYNKRKKHNKCDDYNSDIKHITGFNG